MSDAFPMRSRDDCDAARLRAPLDAGERNHACFVEPRAVRLVGVEVKIEREARIDADDDIAEGTGFAFAADLDSIDVVVGHTERARIGRGLMWTWRCAMIAPRGMTSSPRGPRKVRPGVPARLPDSRSGGSRPKMDGILECASST